jgi:hypothetical protein
LMVQEVEFEQQALGNLLPAFYDFYGIRYVLKL